jgi:hypothetical protein
MISKVYLEEKDLIKRESKLRLLLEPISTHNSGPASKRVSRKGEIIFGLYDGSFSDIDYRDWRFDTYKKQYSGMYFEKWCYAEESEKNWYLERAYLSLFKIEKYPPTEKEYVALHCDPFEPKESKHFFYKVGPHIHIIQAEQPLPHAHIPLNRCHLDEVLNSIDDLSRALEKGIEMLKEQILDQAIQ